MNIEFEKEISWTPALEGVVTWAKVDGKRVGCVLEGRAIAKYFGAENVPGRIEAAYMRNRSFMEDIVRDAIERQMFNQWGEVLLGEEELTPYFQERDRKLAAATAPA